VEEGREDLSKKKITSIGCSKDDKDEKRVVGEPEPKRGEGAKRRGGFLAGSLRESKDRRISNDRKPTRWRRVPSGYDGRETAAAPVERNGRRKGGSKLRYRNGSPHNFVGKRGPADNETQLRFGR